MGVPTVKTIKARLDWLDKTELGDTGATVARQAMQWAEEGGEPGPTLEAFVETHTPQYPVGAFERTRSYEDRIRVALQFMDQALETHGVEYIGGVKPSSVYPRGIEYLNTGDPYIATVIYDYLSGTWKVTSWGDMVETYPSRFPY